MVNNIVKMKLEPEKEEKNKDKIQNFLRVGSQIIEITRNKMK